MKINIFDGINIFKKSDTCKKTTVQKFSPERSYPNLEPLQTDKVDFKPVLRKKDFSKIENYFLDKFGIDTKHLRDKEDLEKIAERKFQHEYNDKLFTGKDTRINANRNYRYKKWYEFLSNQNSSYPTFIKVLVLDSLKNEINPDNTIIPPILNKETFEKTIKEFEESIENGSLITDFNELYKNNLENSYLKNFKPDKNQTGWIVIPSILKDKANFAQNTDKLKFLSLDIWSTRTFGAQKALKQGDFHIFLDKGVPKIGISFIGQTPDKILTESSDSKIPTRYYETINDYLAQNDFKPSTNAKKQLNKTKEKKDSFARIRKRIGEEAIKNLELEKIAPYFWLGAKKDTDGLYILDSFRIQKQFSFEDIGIDENKMFEKIKKIEGDANFTNSTVTDLGNLVEIGGDAKFANAQLESTCKLKKISGNANFRHSSIKNLNELEEIGKDADFSHSQITSLGKLKTIGQDANFKKIKLESLGNLENIGNSVCFSDVNIKDLGKLNSVGNTITLKNTNLTEDDFKNIYYYDIETI